MELSGISFARQHGLTPEDWARHLWSRGAAAWMGTDRPDAAAYLLEEVAAFRRLYPAVRLVVGLLSPGQATLTFQPGTCLGGWGKDQWGLARSLGLGKGHVCRYCREAFRAWSRQLGLAACPEPSADGTCTLTAESAERTTQ